VGRVDHAAVVAGLKAHIVEAGKPGFGARELLEKIGRLEVEHAVDDDRYAQFLGKFGLELEAAFRGVLPPHGGASSDEAAVPLTPTGLSVAAKDQLARPSRDSSSPEGAPPHEHDRHARDRASRAVAPTPVRA
jgi:hypothetical protein